MLTLADIVAFYSAEQSPENSGARRSLGIEEEAERTALRTPLVRRHKRHHRLPFHHAAIMQREGAPCRPAAR